MALEPSETLIEIRPNRSINILKVAHSNDPTIFLIHGLGGRADQWRKQISEFKNHFNIITPDLFGLGKSAKPRSWFEPHYDFANFDQDLDALFDRFASTNNILVGHSYGGALAVSLAMKHAKEIQKLILITPVPCQPRYPLPSIMKWPAFVLEWLRPKLEKFFNESAYDKSCDPQLINEEAIKSRVNPMYVVREMAQGMTRIPLKNVSELFIPTLVIVGENDKLTKPEVVSAFYQKMPEVEFKLIPDAGHMVILEKSDLVNQAILKFLQK